MSQINPHSDQKVENESAVRARTAARARAVTAVAALLSFALYTWAWPMPPRAQLALFAVAAFAVLFRSSLLTIAVLVLAWAGPLLILRGPLVANDRLWFGDVVAAISLLAFVLFSLRYAQLHTTPLDRRGPGATGPSWPALELRPFAGAGLRLVLATGIALALLWSVSLEAMNENTPRLIPAALRGLVLLWGLSLTALIASAAFSVLKWRQLSPQQASLFVRRAMADELESEWTAIERAHNRLAAATTRKADR